VLKLHRQIVHIGSNKMNFFTRFAVIFFSKACNYAIPAFIMLLKFSNSVGRENRPVEFYFLVLPAAASEFMV